MFEGITHKVEERCELMPYEEDELTQIFQELLDQADISLSDKLSEISSVENLLEIRTEFEKRVRDYFKSIEVTNKNESRQVCNNLLMSLYNSKVSQPRIEEISDIEPSLMASLKSNCTDVILDYRKSAQGPEKCAVLSEFFQTQIIDKLLPDLIKDIDQAYTNAQNKTKLQISDITRMTTKLTTILEQT